MVPIPLNAGAANGPPDALGGACGAQSAKILPKAYNGSTAGFHQKVRPADNGAAQKVDKPNEKRKKSEKK